MSMVILCYNRGLLKVKMENLINEMAENLKGFQANAEAQIKEVSAQITVVKDELQKQIDGQLAAQKKAEKKEVKFIDQVIMEKLDGNFDAMEKSLKNNGKYRLDLSDVKTMTLSGNLTGDAHRCASAQGIGGHR